MVELVEVCGLADLAEDGLLGFEVAGNRLAICRRGDHVHAVEARCPHANGPLDRGRIEEGEVVCPWHHWRFRLGDGRCMTTRGHALRVFPCEVREGRVFVEIRH